MAVSKLYDLMVFGVTGFTGRYVAEEIHRIQTTHKKDLKWAVAGRNESKIQGILKDLNIEDIDVVIADVNDEQSIFNMCSKSRVVLDIVGPYLKYGEVVVKSCIKGKADYIDITGEEYFVEKMMARYGEEAQRAGVYIVNHCGYDSIPTEIGTSLLRKHLGELDYAECYMQTKTEVVNIGTFESMLMIIRTQRELQKIRKSAKPAYLSAPFAKTSIPKRWPVFYSPLTRSWCMNMDGPDKTCARRTAYYRHSNFEVPMMPANVYFSVGSFPKLLGFIFFLMLIIPLNATNWGYKLLCKYPRIFTAGNFSRAGPTKEQVARASCTVLVEGSSSSNTENKPRRARVTIQGGEPAYEVTSVTIVHGAMCLLEERDKLPTSGGIYSPGAAFGETNIAQRMEESGQIKFNIKDL